MHFFDRFRYRRQFGSHTEEEETAKALAHLRTLVEFEGPQSIAAIILETVPGTAGIMVPPPGYLTGVRELCNQYGIMLIFDEAMAGFGVHRKVVGAGPLRGDAIDDDVRGRHGLPFSD